MNTKISPPCVYCKSLNVIKHGTTTTGNKRYRCRSCGKTWVLERSETVRPEIADVVEAYLQGKTCRDLVNVYHSSPLRINQKIREFLDGCPNWEDYLDACERQHETRLVYLVGRYFSCASKEQHNGNNDSSSGNMMYLAMAIDAMSTVVLGYEIGQHESAQVWTSLLDRLNCRGYICPVFMGSGSKQMEEAVQTVFPYSALRVYYYRAFRDKEIACCLARMPINSKLMNDANKAFDSFKNKNLNTYLLHNAGKKFREYLAENSAHFSRRLKERLEHRPEIRIEGLSSAFQQRFEKFHMLKDNPQPLVNGWIAEWMLSRLDIGFSRLSVYMQTPIKASFRNFACGQKPIVMDLDSDSLQLRSFVVEIAVRGLQLPNFFSRCELKLDKCSLLAL